MNDAPQTLFRYVNPCPEDPVLELEEGEYEVIDLAAPELDEED